MDNRGKHWSIDDDQKLMEQPHLSNAYFSHMMGRSENAIKMRRDHLAVKMYQNDSSTSLEEYVGLMFGDLAQAQLLLQEFSEKRATFKNFMDTSRKRKAAPVVGEQRVLSRFFKDDAEPWQDKSPEERISSICQSIREEGGNLASVFNDEEFLPVLVQHYPGFEAYARIVQARTSEPAGAKK